MMWMIRSWTLSLKPWLDKALGPLVGANEFYNRRDTDHWGERVDHNWLVR